MPETLVLLHGFSGTRRAWDGVRARLDPERYLPLALDLPGHGEASGAQPPITFASCVEQALDAAPARFALCGYSLGGRVAMQIALAAPERVSRLYLIACSPGIENASQRAARLQADLRLAEELESEPFEEFIERWRTQALFAADPPAVGELARADQRRNSPRALAEVMRGLSVGRMESLWPRLEELTIRTTVIVGGRDHKFRAIGERMAGMLPDGRLVVVSGGHGLALENPAAVAAALEGLDPQAGA